MYLRPSRRKKRRKLTNLIILIAIIAAAAIGVFFLLSNFTDFQLFQPLFKESATHLPQNAQANENGILYTDEGTLYLSDNKGSPVWDLKLDAQDAKFVSSPSLICTYAQANLQVLSYSKEQLFSTSVASEILDVSSGKDTVGVLTSVTNEEGNAQFYLTLFNSRGEQLGQIDYKTRQVIAFGFTGDSDMLWSLSLDSTNVVPVSYITTYKSDGSPIGSIENNTQIMDHIYVTSDSIFASGTNNLFSYSHFGEKQNEAPIYGWKPAAVSVEQAGFHAAYTPRSQTVSMETVKLFGNDLSEISFYLPQETLGIAITQDRLFAYTPDSVVTYQLTGEIEKTTKIDYTLTAMKQLSSNLVAAWDKDGTTYLMQLS